MTLAIHTTEVQSDMISHLCSVEPQ